LSHAFRDSRHPPSFPTRRSSDLNAVTRGAALALSAIRKKGLDAVPQASLPLFTRPQSTFLGTASQVEAYVYALARFEPKPAQFPRAGSKRKADAPRAPRDRKSVV